MKMFLTFSEVTAFGETDFQEKNRRNNSVRRFFFPVMINSISGFHLIIFIKESRVQNYVGAHHGETLDRCPAVSKVHSDRSKLLIILNN